MIQYLRNVGLNLSKDLRFVNMTAVMKALLQYPAAWNFYAFVARSSSSGIGWFCLHAVVIHYGLSPKWFSAELKVSSKRLETRNVHIVKVGLVLFNEYVTLVYFN